MVICIGKPIKGEHDFYPFPSLLFPFSGWGEKGEIVFSRKEVYIIDLYQENSRNVLKIHLLILRSEPSHLNIIPSK